MKYNTSAKNLAGGMVPNVYVNSVELETTPVKDKSMSKDPHTTSVRTYRNYNSKSSRDTFDTALKATLNMSINPTSMGFLFDRKQDMEYLKIMVIQCSTKKAHDKVNGSAFEYLRGLIKTANRNEFEAGAIKTKILSVEQFLTFKYNQSLGQDFIGRDEILDNETEIPYALTATSKSDSFYSIPLEADFIIGEDQGGTKATFLSYFVFCFFDNQQKALDAYKTPNSSRLSDFFSIGKVSSEIVITAGKVNSNTFAFRQEDGTYWNGPVHQMSNGKWMKYSSHTRGMQGSELELLTIPNAKIRDHRVHDRLASLKIDLVGNDAYTTTNPRLIDQLRKDSNLDLIKKKRNIFSDFYITRDKSNNSRFLFTINMEELIKENTDFPKIVDNVKMTDSVGYQRIMDSARITDLKIKRFRVKSNERLTSQVERTSLVTDQETVIVANSADSETNRGVLESRERTTSRQDPRNKNLRPKTFGLIEEITLNTSVPNTGLRHFTGTDYDISENRDGEYQYILEIEVQDPVMSFLRSNLSQMQTIIRGDINGIGFEQYYKDSLEKKSYFDTFTKKFNLSFLEFYNSKYNADTDENAQDNNFLFRSISTMTKIYYQLSSQLRSSDLSQAAIMNYLSNIASPNVGSPEGIEKVLQLMYSLESSLAMLIQKNSKYVKYRGDVSTEANATNPSIQSSRIDKKTKIEHIFPNKFNAKTNPNIGYDYLFSRKGDGERNTDGLALLNKTDIINRFSLETSKYFKANSVDVTIQDRGGNVYNEGDKLENTKYSFLSVSNIFLLQEDKDVAYSNTNPPTRAFSRTQLNDVLSQVSVINQNKDLFYGSKSREGIDKTEQNLMESFAMSNGTTINENRLLKKRNTKVTTNQVFSSDARVDNIDEGENLFNREQREENNRPLPVGTKEMLTSADQIANRNFISEDNSIKFYFVNDDEGAATFKKQLENRESRSQTAIERGELDLKNAPNQVKALMLSIQKSGVVNEDRMFDGVGEYVNESVDIMRDPANAGSIFFNYKNLRKVEVFRGFDQIKGTASVKNPVWTVLTKTDIDNIKTGNGLFCRHVPYNNTTYGLSENDNLSLPTYNEFFFVTENVSDVNSTSPRGEFILGNSISTQRQEYKAPSEVRKVTNTLFNSRGLATEPNKNNQMHTIRPEFMNSNIVVKGVNATSLGIKSAEEQNKVVEDQIADSKKNSFVLANEIEQSGLGEFLPKGFKKNRFDFARTQATNNTNNTNGTSN